jgi:hypothetical protein
MATVSFLYEDMPVKITDEDCKKLRGLDLDKEIEGNSKEKITQFLDTVHSHIYDFLIFTTGDRRWKTKIIEKYKTEVEKPLKTALLVQASYLISNGNIEMWNGIVKTVNGVDIKENIQFNEKIIAPSVINILSSCKPNLLFAGR